MSRPPLIWSSVASCLARWTGFLVDAMTTAVPKPMVLVTAATWHSRDMGSSTGVEPMICSCVQRLVIAECLGTPGELADEAHVHRLVHEHLRDGDAAGERDRPGRGHPRRPPWGPGR